MKKVINGKRYDTDGATLIGDYCNEQYDFTLFTESLYRKRTGEYFLHGEGRAGSKYGKWQGIDRQVPGADIIPISADDARAWAEKHLDADTYATHFELDEDDESKTAILLRMPVPLGEKLRMAALDAGVSMTEYVIRLIQADAASKERK